MTRSVVVTESEPPDSLSLGRLEFIDGLRGLAAAMVIAAHYYPAAYTLGLPRWADSFSLGYLGVHLFLLLSGFCVSWGYLGARPRPFSARAFATRRALRILPAYYCALLLAAWLAAPNFTPAELAWQLVTHALMLHNLSPATALALNPPFWSLALECQLYVCFPFMLIAFRRLGLARCLLIIAVIQTVFRFAVLRYGTEFNATLVVLPWSVAGRLSEFALGLTAAILVSTGRLYRLPLIGRRALLPGMLSLFAIALVCKRLLGTSHPLSDGLFSLGFFLMLLNASLHGSILGRILSWRPLLSMGMFSYSIYLVHDLVISHLMPPLVRVSALRTHPLLILPVMYVASIVCGYTFYRLVERPAIKLFSHSRAPSGQSVPST